MNILFQQIEEMQKKIQNIIIDDDVDTPKRQLNNKGVINDEGYFNTYSHFAIHHEMLTVINCWNFLYNYFFFSNIKSPFNC